MTTERRANLCVRCGGSAWVIETDLEWCPEIRSAYCVDCAKLLNREQAETERRQRVNDLLARAGCAPKWKDWSLDTYPDDEAARRVKTRAVEWFENYLYGGARGNLLLYGAVSSGKTGLAWSLVRRACEEEKPALLVNFGDYLAALRRSFNTHEHVDESWQRVPLLALDDLGTERPTDFARDQLLRLVDYRHRYELPMIVTSNYKLSELGKRLGHDDPTIGQRIVARLADSAVQIPFESVERRRLRAA